MLTRVQNLEIGFRQLRRGQRGRTWDNEGCNLSGHQDGAQGNLRNTHLKLGQHGRLGGSRREIVQVLRAGLDHPGRDLKSANGDRWTSTLAALTNSGEESRKTCGGFSRLWGGTTQTRGNIRKRREVRCPDRERGRRSSTRGLCDGVHWKPKVHLFNPRFASNGRTCFVERFEQGQRRNKSWGGERVMENG